MGKGAGGKEGGVLGVGLGRGFGGRGGEMGGSLQALTENQMDIARYNALTEDDRFVKIRGMVQDLATPSMENKESPFLREIFSTQRKRRKVVAGSRDPGWDLSEYDVLMEEKFRSIGIGDPISGCDGGR